MTHSYDMEELRPELLPPPDANSTTQDDTKSNGGPVSPTTQNGNKKYSDDQHDKTKKSSTSSGGLKLSHDCGPTSLIPTSSQTPSLGVDTGNMISNSGNSNTNTSNVGSGLVVTISSLVDLSNNLSAAIESNDKRNQRSSPNPPSRPVPAKTNGNFTVEEGDTIVSMNASDPSLF